MPGETTDIKAPYLLALPNALVELLRDQNTPATLADVLSTINEVTANAGGGLAEDLWSTVQDWCICARQAGQNNKSLLSIELDSVKIDDDEFDTWVGHKLNQALGPHPTHAQQAVTTPQQPPVTDYLQLSQLLAATVGQEMMHFTQAVAPQAPAAAILLGQMASLKTGKGFNRDQIAKLKDACGVTLTKDIPHIWCMIQSTKGKAYNMYPNYLKKSIKSWCCTCHIKQDKSIYLTAKFFNYLVALRFNPGRPVSQYDSDGRGISMLACCSLTVIEAEY